MRRWVIVVFVLYMVFGVTAAQDAPLAGTPVEVEASTDAFMLKGEIFYPADAEGAVPAVLLLHQNRGNRDNWLPLIPALNAAGFAALAVDLRGFGETAGRNDFVVAQQDTLDWLTFLRADSAIDGQRLFTIGASIGSHLALVGCAADEACAGAAALSPSLDYFGVKPQDAVVKGLVSRPVLLISGQRDSQSALGTRLIANDSRGNLTLRMYPDSAHGTAFLTTRGDSFNGFLVGWLTEANASLVLE